jgi:hypothetical protein
MFYLFDFIMGGLLKKNNGWPIKELIKEKQIPNRLLKLAIIHIPLKST